MLNIIKYAKEKKWFISAISLSVVLVVTGVVLKFSFKQESNVALAKVAELPAETFSTTEVTQEVIIPATPELEEEAEADKKPEVITYTVKSGDTLEAIANTYKVSVATIAESSGINKDNLLKPGQELRFPSVNGILHKVKDGENLWDISDAYDVNVQTIVDSNNMSEPDKLKIGQELIVVGAVKKKIVNEPVKTASKPSKSTSSSSSKKVASRGSTSKSGIWPVNGYVSSPFGQRGGEFHKGMDIAAPTGTDIKAFMSGTVISSGWNNSGYGYLVTIRHSNGLVTYYAHCSKLLVKAGQHVERGQHIAEVGSTGNSTGPHLHFEVRRSGSPVNPRGYLK